MSVTIRGLEAVRAKVSSLESADAFRRGVATGATRIKEFMATYPAQVHKPQPFKTEKQRRFVMAALKEGRLSFPYGRTGSLGRRWTIVFSNGGQSATIGNNTEYGPLVQQAGAQAGYHAGNWQTDQDAIDQMGPLVTQDIDAEIGKVING